MKRPEYVAVVTRIYAALLKENRKPTAGERRQLSSRPRTTHRIPSRAASSAPAREWTVIWVEPRTSAAS